MINVFGFFEIQQERKQAIFCTLKVYFLLNNKDLESSILKTKGIPSKQIIDKYEGVKNAFLAFKRALKKEGKLSIATKGGQRLRRQKQKMQIQEIPILFESLSNDNISNYRKKV